MGDWQDYPYPTIFWVAPKSLMVCGLETRVIRSPKNVTNHLSLCRLPPVYFYWKVNEPLLAKILALIIYVLYDLMQTAYHSLATAPPDALPSSINGHTYYSDLL